MHTLVALLGNSHTRQINIKLDRNHFRVIFHYAVTVLTRYGLDMDSICTPIKRRQSVYELCFGHKCIALYASTSPRLRIRRMLPSLARLLVHHFSRKIAIIALAAR